MNLVFNNLKVFKKYNHEGIYRKLAEILKELKIKGSIVNLRHTFATNHFVLGTPDKIISEWLGHSSISTLTKDV